MSNIIDLSETPSDAENLNQGGICGIDLGTTNTSVYYVREGDVFHPEVIKDKEGNMITPSIVYAKKGEEKDMKFGIAAEQMKKIDPQNTYYEIKRFIGRRY